METLFCQSCGMPLTEELFGTESDGTESQDYCKYCYQQGAFTYPASMEQMIDTCIPPMLEANPGMTEEQARAMMQGFLPNLKRWKQG